MNSKTRFAVRTPASTLAVTHLRLTVRRRASTRPPSRSPFFYRGATSQTSSGSISRRKSQGWCDGQKTTTGCSPPERQPTDTRPLRAVLRLRILHREEEEWLVRSNAAVWGAGGCKVLHQGGQVLVRNQVLKVPAIFRGWQCNARLQQNMRAV